MSTALDTRSEVEILDALDFETEDACEARTECENSADWVVRCRFCGFSALWCEGCRGVLFTRWAEFRRRHPETARVGCETCWKQRPNPDDLFVWLPIRGGA